MIQSPCEHSPGDGTSEDRGQGRLKTGNGAVDGTVISMGMWPSEDRGRGRRKARRAVVGQGSVPDVDPPSLTTRSSSTQFIPTNVGNVLLQDLPSYLTLSN